MMVFVVGESLILNKFGQHFGWIHLPIITELITAIMQNFDVEE